MTTPRLAWPDALKGAAIILVVLLHTTSTHYVLLDGVPDALRTGWGMVSSFLAPIRIPIFFLISGWLASKYIRQPIGVSVRKRIIGPLYLYVLWVFIHGLIFAGLDPDSARSITGQPGIGVVLATAETSLWYLLALAVFFVLSWVTASLPAGVVLTGAAILSLASLVPPLDGFGGLGWMAQNLLWYMAGAHLRRTVRDTTQSRNTVGKIITIWACYAVTASLFLIQRKTAAISGVEGVLVEWALLTGASLIGIIAALWTASRIKGRSRPVRVLRSVGEDTIAIYVLHVPIIALLHLAVSWVPMPTALAAVWPIIATALVCIAAYWAGQGLRKIGAGFLFRLPERTSEPERVNA